MFCFCLFTGQAASDFIANRSHNGLTVERLQQFRTNVVKYYKRVASYLVEKLPFHSPLLTQIEFCDPDKCWRDGMLKNLLALVERFPCVMPANATKDELMTQFSELQAALCSRDAAASSREFSWNNMKKDHPGEFNIIIQVILGLLTIPHSSAHCERVFSCVRKNKTDFRGSLSNDTLEALMVIKHRPGDFLSHVYSKDTLQFLKGSCLRSLKKD